MKTMTGAWQPRTPGHCKSPLAIVAFAMCIIVSPAHATPAPGNQDEQARQLLMSSAWCSFTYNKTSGASNTRRAVFRPDGILQIGSGAESYSSGYGGTVAGQSRNASAMQWRLENMRLYVNDSGRGFQDVGLSATRNSNGSVILKADGKEYAMCR